MAFELDYGNARVRALRSRLLAAEDFERLVEMKTEQLVVALGDTPYRPEIEAGLLQSAGRRLLHEALSNNLARTLATVRGSFAGEARRALELLTGHWDLSNLLAVLRGQLVGAPPDEVMALLVPAGRLDRTALHELARQADARSALELMIAWGLPYRGAAAGLLGAWRRHEISPDSAMVEHALQRAYAEEITEAIQEAWLPPLLERLLRAKIDKTNILIALRRQRIRGAALPDEMRGELADLPGGAFAPRVLERAERTGAVGEAVRVLVEACPRHIFAEALRALANHENLAELDRDMEGAIAGVAARGFIDADPLSLAVPIAFVSAKEEEIRTLRLIVEAAAGHIPREDVRWRWRRAKGA